MGKIIESEVLINEYVHNETQKVRKKAYDGIVIVPVKMVIDSPVLAASIIDKTKIQAAGQETTTYDLSNGTGAESGKEFSHEWNMGND